MPRYMFRCDKCGKEIESTCSYKETKNKVCSNCGYGMTVQITKMD